MVWCNARLLRQIRHQISLGHYEDRHVGCFYYVFSVIEERSEDFREALSNIARQARSFLQNFSDNNVQPIEQRMLDERPRESGVLLSTRTPSSS